MKISAREVPVPANLHNGAVGCLCPVCDNLHFMNRDCLLCGGCKYVYKEVCTVYLLQGRRVYNTVMAIYKVNPELLPNNARDLASKWEQGFGDS